MIFTDVYYLILKFETGVVKKKPDMKHCIAFKLIWILNYLYTKAVTSANQPFNCGVCKNNNQLQRHSISLVYFNNPIGILPVPGTVISACCIYILPAITSNFIFFPFAYA